MPDPTATPDLSEDKRQWLRASMLVVIYLIVAKAVMTDEGIGKLHVLWSRDKFQALAIGGFAMLIALTPLRRDAPLRHAVRSGLAASFVALMASLDYVAAPFWFVMSSVLLFGDV